MTKPDRQPGFSLVELVVVVTIIAIIASIAIPRISQGAKGANEAAVAGDLRMMRDSVLRYAAEHGNSFPGPDADTVADQLCQFSDKAGATSATRAAPRIYGPYLSSIPPCPIGHYPGNTAIAIDTANSPPKPKPGTAAGWVYNPNTGEIIPNSPDFAEVSGEPVGGEVVALP